MLRHLVGIAVAAALLLPSISLADDWLAGQLRGNVFVYANGKWQPLQRGALVADTEMIRTMASGHVVFTRGQETVDVGPNTQLQIFDKGHTKPFTTVKQYFGSISVEAQVENVQHFAVDTPFLAAVVKGTRFTVTSGKRGSSVAVQRGHVAVEDFHTRAHTVLAVNQTATIDLVKTDGQIVVSRVGELPPVTDAAGNPLVTPSSSETGASESLGLEVLDAQIGNGTGVTMGIGRNDDGSSLGVGGTLSSNGAENDGETIKDRTTVDRSAASSASE